VQREHITEQEPSRFLSLPHAEQSMPHVDSDAQDILNIGSGANAVWAMNDDEICEMKSKLESDKAQNTVDWADSKFQTELYVLSMTKNCGLCANQNRWIKTNIFAKETKRYHDVQMPNYTKSIQSLARSSNHSRTKPLSQTRVEIEIWDKSAKNVSNVR
jgi:hypothetical protein